jgi:hypothetical protein
MPHAFLTILIACLMMLIGICGYYVRKVEPAVPPLVLW